MSCVTTTPVSTIPSCKESLKQLFNEDPFLNFPTGTDGKHYANGGFSLYSTDSIYLTEILVTPDPQEKEAALQSSYKYLGTCEINSKSNYILKIRIPKGEAI